MYTLSITRLGLTMLSSASLAPPWELKRWVDVDASEKFFDEIFFTFLLWNSTNNVSGGRFLGKVLDTLLFTFFQYEMAENIEYKERLPINMIISGPSGSILVTWRWSDENKLKSIFKKKCGNIKKSPFILNPLKIVKIDLNVSNISENLFFSKS